MSIPYDAVLTEAFRRAQVCGRVFLQTCDFPPSVSADTVERVYLAPLRACTSATSGATHTTPQKSKVPVLQRGPIEVTSYSRESDDASFLTNGGDAWAAVLLLEESVQ